MHMQVTYRAAAAACSSGTRLGGLGAGAAVLMRVPQQGTDPKPPPERAAALRQALAAERAAPAACTASATGRAASPAAWGRGRMGQLAEIRPHPAPLHPAPLHPTFRQSQSRAP